MFFSIFNNNPRIPDGWTASHLWVAQCIVASIIMDERGSKPWKKLRRQVLTHFNKMCFLKKCQWHFPDDQFRDAVMAGIDEYLSSESASILAYLRSESDEMLRPKKEILMDLLRTDHRFAEYIRLAEKRMK